MEGMGPTTRLQTLEGLSYTLAFLRTNRLPRLSTAVREIALRAIEKALSYDP